MNSFFLLIYLLRFCVTITWVAMSSVELEGFFKTQMPFVRPLIYWENPRYSAASLLAILVPVEILATYPSWIVYYVLKVTVLITTLTFTGLGISNFLQVLMGKTAKNPFSFLFSDPPKISQEKAQELAGQASSVVNYMVQKLMSLIFMERPLQTFEFLSATWLLYKILYYLPFSRLLHLSAIALYCIPISIVKNQELVDKYKALAQEQIENLAKRAKELSQQYLTLMQEQVHSFMNKQNPKADEAVALKEE